jgi:hypothetical protein
MSAQATANEYVVHETLRLARGALIRIQDARGLLIAVREGRIWLTQEHDPNDVVVDAHDSFQLDRDGVAILSTCRESLIRLTAPAAPGFAGQILVKRTVTSKPVALYDEKPVRASIGVWLEGWWHKRAFHWLAPAGRPRGAAR